MRYGSVASGIEAASVAWEPLGWTPEFFAEIEPFPNAVLRHRWPKVPNLGDMTKFKEWKHGSIDLLVGGTPCQSFSIAGLRKGLADPRGNLALTFLAILDRARPEWVVWENVPGVLSSWSDEAGSFVPDGEEAERGFQTNDFDTFTCGLRELGYGLAWRVLDAQHFGVPQRRRRVFVVGHLRDWRRAAAVLFEPQSLSWDIAPRRTPREGSPACFTARADGGGQPDDISPTIDARAKDGPRRNQGGTIVSTFRMTDFGGYVPDESAGTVKGRDQKDATDLIAHTLTGEGFDASPDGTGRGVPLITDMRGNGDGNISPTLSASSSGDRPTDFAPMIFESRVARNGRGAPSEVAPALKAQSGRTGKGDAAPIVFSSKDHGGDAGDTSPTLRAGAHSGSHPNAGVPPAVTMGATVRRLTPRECERLQGFPDDHTLVPFRGRAAADGPRYRAIGNSMAVPVMRWIGKRIAMIDAIK